MCFVTRRPWHGRCHHGVCNLLNPRGMGRIEASFRNRDKRRPVRLSDRGFGGWAIVGPVRTKAGSDSLCLLFWLLTAVTAYAS